MAKVSAEFFGECQICGRKHKAPNGFVAKHGYVVKGYGFFVGTCHGADALPYEKSCELLKEVILEQKVAVANLQKHHDNDFPVITDPTTQMLAPSYFKRRGTSYSGTKIFSVMAQAVAYMKTESFTFYRMEPLEVLEGYELVRYNNGSQDTNPLVLLNQLQKKAQVKVEMEIENRKEWISWAESRVKNWTLKDLTPVAKDENAPRILNRFEAKIVQEIKDNKEPVTFNDRHQYYVKNTVTYNRVATLVKDGFLKKLQEGSNKDGNYLQVTLA